MSDDFLARLDALDARDRKNAAPANVAGNSNLLQWADDNVRRAADSATFGYADKLAARMSSLFGDTYENELAAERKRTEDAGKRLGKGAIVADVAGGVAGGLAGGTLLRGGAALSALRGGSQAPARAILAADNAGIAGRAAVGATEGLAMTALDAAGRDKELTRGNMLAGAALGGGVAGGLAAAGRARLPAGNMTAEDQRLASVLRNEGVELTAGQRTGSKPVQWMETVLADLPFTGQPGQRIADAQARAFNSAALRTAGSNADEATGAVMTATQRTLGNRIENIAARNTIQFDRQFVQDVRTVASEYAENLNTLQKPIFERLVLDIGATGGVMSGTAYQKLRSTLTRISRSEGDTELANALRGLRGALDDAATRSINPADARAWDATRRQYANYKTIEKAMKGAGAEVAGGNISPRQLRAAIAQRDPEGYVQGRGDMTDLAKAAERFMKPLPNSGTAPRSFYQGLFQGGGTIGGLVGGGLPGAVIGAAAGTLGPAAASRVLYSRPVQRFLGDGSVLPPAGDLSKGIQQGLLGGMEDKR
jgi:hypothetical protein